MTQVSTVKAHPNHFSPDKLLSIPTTGEIGAYVPSIHPTTLALSFVQLITNLIIS